MVVRQLRSQIDRRWLRLAVRRLKRTVEFIGYTIFDSVALVFTRRVTTDERKVGVVQLKLLGDYILWLPYGRALLQHFHAHNKRVVLIINQAWAELAQRHCPGYDIYAIERRRFIRDWRYRLKTLRELNTLAVSAVYHSSVPRYYLNEDAVVRALDAPAYGFDAVFIDRPWIDRKWSQRYYHNLIPTIPGVHQTVHHRRFLQAIGVDEPVVEDHVSHRPNRQFISGNRYYIIAPGASEPARCWPVERFAKIARLIADRYDDWHCVVIGTKGERVLGERIGDAMPGRVLNLAGQTTIPELVDCVRHAELLLGNDSAAVHIAAACDIPSVAVVGGGHYGRCLPYDPSEARAPSLPVAVAYPMGCFGCDWICRFRTSAHECFPCINKITVEAVWSKVQHELEATTGPSGSKTIPS